MEEKIHSYLERRSIKVNIHPKKDYLYFEIIINIGDYAQIQKGRIYKGNIIKEERLLYEKVGR